jgi:enediyne biosynthesis protein E7
VVSDPETIKRVLVSNHRNYTIGVGLDRVRLLVGNGIIVSEGEVWKTPASHDAADVPALAGRAVRPMIADVSRRRLAGWAIWPPAAKLLQHDPETSEGALEVVLRAVLRRRLRSPGAISGANPFALLTEESAIAICASRIASGNWASISRP